MDPVSHSLIDATLAQSGLKRRTALGTATLLIGATPPTSTWLPTSGVGERALAFRRGLTHGILAVFCLPVALAGVLWLWDRGMRRRGRQDSEPAPFSAARPPFRAGGRPHPLLDYLSVYGVRLLAPFSPRWLYGDALFIVDPSLCDSWLSGCWLARRNRRWAAASLVTAASHAVTLGASGAVARSLVRDSLLHEGRFSPRRAMAAPLAVTPFRRYVVVEERWELPRRDVRLDPAATGGPHAPPIYNRERERCLQGGGGSERGL